MKRLIATAAAAALALAPGVASAAPAVKLSLKNAPAARTATAARKGSRGLGSTAVLGIVTVGLLTGVFIFLADDSTKTDSP